VRRTKGGERDRERVCVKLRRNIVGGNVRERAFKRRSEGYRVGKRVNKGN
jgi:hypothetical protein